MQYHICIFEALSQLKRAGTKQSSVCKSRIIMELGVQVIGLSEMCGMQQYLDSIRK